MPTLTGTRGAFTTVLAQPFGRTLLLVAAVGLLGYAVWRFLRQKLDWGRGDAFEVMLAIDQYLDEVIGASLRGFFEATERSRAGEAGDDEAEVGGEGGD